MHFLPSSVFMQILLLYLLLYDKKKPKRYNYGLLDLKTVLKALNSESDQSCEYNGAVFARMLIGCNLLNVIKKMKLISLSCFNYVTATSS